MRLGQSGRRIFRIALGGHATHRWNAPYLNIHRADLLAALLSRARAIEAIEIRLNARLSHYGQSEQVTARFENGESLSDHALPARSLGVSRFRLRRSRARHHRLPAPGRAQVNMQ